jgi:DNA-binding transcriptional MerR regulator
MAQPQGLFTSQQVSEITGISIRQLHHWDRTGLVSPGLRTPGGHRRYSFQDVLALKTAKRLLESGVSLRRLRSVIARLRQVLPTIKKPLNELTLVVAGEAILVFYERTAFEAITGQHWILEVADLQRDVQRWQKRIAELSRYRTLRKVTIRARGDLSASRS